MHRKDVICSVRMNAAPTSNPLRMFPRYTINNERNSDDGCGRTLVGVGMLELAESLKGERVGIVA